MSFPFDYPAPFYVNTLFGSPEEVSTIATRKEYRLKEITNTERAIAIPIRSTQPRNDKVTTSHITITLKKLTMKINHLVFSIHDCVVNSAVPIEEDMFEVSATNEYMKITVHAKKSIADQIYKIAFALVKRFTGVKPTSKYKLSPYASNDTVVLFGYKNNSNTLYLDTQLESHIAEMLFEEQPTVMSILGEDEILARIEGRIQTM